MRSVGILSLNAHAEGPLSGRQGFDQQKSFDANKESPGDAITDARFQTGM
jgi:hypothetical protein